LSGSGAGERWVVGTPVRFEVVGREVSGIVPVRLLGEAGARRARLLLRRGDPPPIGEELDGWIVEDASEPLVTTDDFGRLPISGRQRLRYQAAVATGLALLAGDRLGADAADRLSELKGMLNRVARRDQRDWVAVSAAFGHPPRAAAAAWARHVSAARAGLVAGATPEAQRLIGIPH
jgi:hypothetical protein